MNQSPSVSRTTAYLVLWTILIAVTLLRHGPPSTLRIERAVDPPPPLRIDLNRDPWARLTLIEGIGETLARRIVSAREEQGGFASVDEVMALPGIPDRPLEEAREFLVCGMDDPARR